MQPVDIRGIPKDVLDIIMTFAVISAVCAAGFSIFWAVQQYRRKQEKKHQQSSTPVGKAAHKRRGSGRRKQYR
jgi:hypothetical protein